MMDIGTLSKYYENKKLIYKCIYSEVQSELMDKDSSDDDNTRWLFTSTTPPAPVQPFTSSVDLLLVLNSMTVTGGK